MDWSAVIEAAQSVARAHLAPRGATLTVSASGDGILLRVVSGATVYEEFVYLRDRASSREEYVHCRVHALAAKFIPADVDFDGD